MALEGFSRVPADGFFLQFLNFEIQDLSPLAVASRPLREDLRSWRLVVLLCGRECPIHRPGQKLLCQCTEKDYERDYAKK